MKADPELNRALRLLFDAAPPGSQVVLFGSRARGAARPDSDYDFIVIEPETRDRFAEMVRLSALLGSASIPADVIVLSREFFERWKDEPNSLPNRARREGRFYDSAA